MYIPFVCTCIFISVNDNNNPFNRPMGGGGGKELFLIAEKKGRLKTKIPKLSLYRMVKYVL